MNHLISGFSLILLAAIAGGAFAVPLKLRRRYEWENTWLLAWFFGDIVIPLIGVALFLPSLWSILSAAGTRTVLTAMAFGFLWGWGSVTFALGITAIGLSLGYAVMLGIVVAAGSIIPMLRRWGEVPTDARVVILLGIAVCLVGVTVCGVAGVLRERGEASSFAQATAVGGTSVARLATAPTKAGSRKAFLIGLSWCVLSGFLSACANLGFDFADRVALEAQHQGAGVLSATIARWITVFWGSFLAIAIGTGLTIFRKGTWKNFFLSGSGGDFKFTVLMGFLQVLAQIPYGIGAYFLGRLGTTVGWAVNVSLSLLVANVFGFVTREWKDAPSSSIRTLYAGLTVLVIAMVVLVYGNSLVSLPPVETSANLVCSPGR